MNRKLILSAALSGLMLTATAQTTVAPAIPRDGKIEKKVEALLKKMTLEEKIGQMTELTIDVITKRDNSTQEFQIDDALLDTVIGKYKVGSILNVPQGVAQSKEKWEEIIRKIQDKSMKVMGIPCIYGVDQIHGTTYTLGGTFFPQGINMAATFNRELVREGARISAYETKSGSIPWTYAPVLDLARDARWPRHWENYGEDCYVNAEMGREAVFGFQGGDPNHIGKQQVAACIKHYMGYGVPVSGPYPFVHHRAGYARETFRSVPRRYQGWCFVCYGELCHEQWASFSCQLRAADRVAERGLELGWHDCDRLGGYQ